MKIMNLKTDLSKEIIDQTREEICVYLNNGFLKLSNEILTVITRSITYNIPLTSLNLTPCS